MSKQDTVGFPGNVASSHNRHRMVEVWWEQVAEVSAFSELAEQVRRGFEMMRANGYTESLIDEDGESMVVYGVSLGEHHMTLQAYWDDDEGPSVSCSFSGPFGSIALAQSRGSKVVQIDG